MHNLHHQTELQIQYECKKKMIKVEREWDLCIFPVIFPVLYENNKRNVCKDWHIEICELPFLRVTGLLPLTLLITQVCLVPNGTLHVYLCKQWPLGQQNHKHKLFKRDQTLSNAHQYSMLATAFAKITFWSCRFVTLHTNGVTPILYIY